MPVGTVEEGQDRSLREGDVVRVELQSVEQRDISFTDRKTGQPSSFSVWSWTVKVTDAAANPEANGRIIKSDTSAKLTNIDPDNGVCARSYFEAFLGRPLEVGESVDTDIIVGLECDATIRKTTDKQGRVWDALGMLMPIDDENPPF